MDAPSGCEPVGSVRGNFLSWQEALQPALQPASKTTPVDPKEETRKLDQRIRSLSLSLPSQASHLLKTASPLRTSMTIPSTKQSGSEQERGQVESTKEEKLITMIVINKNGIWDKLALASVTLLTSFKLFSLVYDALQKAIDNKNEHETTQLLTFCKVWVDANCKNQAFCQAMPLFLAILEICSENAFAPAKVGGQALHEAISKSPVSKEEHQTPPSTVKDFLPELETAFTNPKCYKALVGDVATDSTQLQISLFCSMTSHAFIPNKWRITPDCIENFYTFFNQISFGIVSFILSERKPENRSKIIAFFLDVANACLQANDLITPQCILAALNYNAISRLKITWSMLSSESTKKFDMLLTLYAPWSNFSVFRAFQEKKFEKSKPFVPNLMLLKKDITPLFEMDPVIKASEQTDFNYENMETICLLIQHYLSVQSRFARTVSIAKTNFISHFVKKYMVMEEKQADDVYYEQSCRREPPLCTDSASSASLQE